MRLWVLLLAPLAFGQDVEAGRQLYMGSCSGCHGATGEGSQGPSLLSGRASRLGDKALFATIRNGLPGTTMPEFRLPEERVREIVAFVRSLTAPAVAVKLPGDTAAGRAYFFGEGKCSGCHMIRGTGGYLGPDLSNAGAERTAHQLRESVLQPSARIAEGFRGAKAVLRTGRTVEGVAKNFNNYSVQIVDRSGRLHLLQRSELAAFEVMEASAMPAVTDKTAAANVIAFLAGQTMRAYEGAAR